MNFDVSELETTGVCCVKMNLCPWTPHGSVGVDDQAVECEALDRSTLSKLERRFPSLCGQGQNRMNSVRHRFCNLDIDGFAVDLSAS